MNIFLDIETIPQQPEEEIKAEIAKTIQAPATMSKQETIDDWHNGAGKYAGVKDAVIDSEYRKTSFNGGKGEIISICVSDGDDFGVFIRDGIGEIALLSMAFVAIDDMVSKKHHASEPYFIGHYIPFDLKFLWHRAVILGIKPPFKLPFDGRHGSHFYDNMQAWEGYKDRISQDNLAKTLGVERRATDITGATVWDAYKAGRIKEIADYNQIDVETAIAIYNKINFIKG